MKKIEDEIFEYFDEQTIPELDENANNKFKELVAKNKNKSKANFWKRFALISAVSVCCLLCLAIPLIALLHNPQPATTFYSDDEATKIDMTETEFDSFIQNEFPQYEFLTTDFSFQSALAFYEPNSDNLLAVRLIADENVQPYTNIQIYLVISNKFTLSNENTYTDNSTYKETDKYKLYNKTEYNVYTENMLSYVIFPSYKLYIQFNCSNYTLLEQFL